VPVADAKRERRRLRVQERLTGLRVEEELELSHFLQDAVFAIYDTEKVRYIRLGALLQEGFRIRGHKDAPAVAPRRPRGRQGDLGRGVRKGGPSVRPAPQLRVPAAWVGHGNERVAVYSI